MDVVYTLAHRLCRDPVKAQEMTVDAFSALSRDRAVAASQPLAETLHQLICSNAASSLAQVATRDAADEWGIAGVYRDASGDRRAADGGTTAVACRLVDLAYFGQMTCSQLATLLDVSPQIIKAQLRIGLQAIAKNGQSDARHNPPVLE